VHAPLRDDFAVKVGEFFQEPDILQQLQTPRPGGHDVLVVDDWTAGVSGEGFFLGHDQTPASDAGEVACKITIAENVVYEKSNITNSWIANIY
jgi:hypothetical protein